MRTTFPMGYGSFPKADSAGSVDLALDTSPKGEMQNFFDRSSFCWDFLL